MRTPLLAGLAVAGALVLGMQLVPYGRDHANPPVRREPTWDRPETRELARRACFDCHSNETSWPWYTNIAPISWLTQRDVDEGRRAVNFSDWDRPQKEAKESAETVQEGEMPPWFYAMVQPQGRLSPAEREALVRGLRATLGSRAGKDASRSSSRAPGPGGGARSAHR
jgi:hypothetical protein